MLINNFAQKAVNFVNAILNKIPLPGHDGPRLQQFCFVIIVLNTSVTGRLKTGINPEYLHTPCAILSISSSGMSKFA